MKTKIENLVDGTKLERNCLLLPEAPEETRVKYANFLAKAHLIGDRLTSLSMEQLITRMVEVFRIVIYDIRLTGEIWKLLNGSLFEALEFIEKKAHEFISHAGEDDVKGAAKVFLIS